MKYLVIGGGIAGVCCTEELCRLSKESDSITLITAGSVLKVRACFVGWLTSQYMGPESPKAPSLLQGVSNVVRITHNIESFEGKQSNCPTSVCMGSCLLQACLTSDCIMQ